MRKKALGIIGGVVLVAALLFLLGLFIGRGTGGEYGVHHGGGRGGVKRDVDEAGTCHFDGGNAIGAIQCVGEQLGEITRFHAGFLRQLHGGVRRPVAVRAILGAHDGEFGGIREFLGRQSAGFTLGNKVIGNGEDQFL